MPLHSDNTQGSKPSGKKLEETVSRSEIPTEILSGSKLIIDRKSSIWEKITSIAMILTVAATISQVAISRAQEKASLRSYLGPVVGSFNVRCNRCSQIFGLKTADLDPERLVDNSFYFKIKNFGLTPAFRNFGCTNAFSIPDEKDLSKRAKEFFKKCQKSIPDYTSPTIWPSDSRNQVDNVADPEILFESLQINSHGYLIGEILYYDIFGSEHHTYICRIFSYVPPTHTILFQGCDLGADLTDN